ncbi:MAG: metallophosphatase family protein [Oscillospiraceae bacterium]|nr:metallophosphatase family protein [Oscillospiraceae bacterium]
MRIIFFSDAHGNQYAARAFFQTVSPLDYDLLVFGGDVFGYYYGCNEVLDLLRQHHVLCLLGNHDQYYLDILSGAREETALVRRYGSTYRGIADRISLDNRNHLAGLNPSLTLETGDSRLLFAHGSPLDPLNGRIYPDHDFSDFFSPISDYDYIFLGHTHHRLYIKSNKTTVINPGSIGQQRDGKGCGYVILETRTGQVSFQNIQYANEPLIQEIKAHREAPEMEARLIEVLTRKPRIFSGGNTA